MARTTLQETAREAAGWFETATREDESTFTRTRDGAPDWVSDLVYAAHGNMLPDDWRYARIAEACEYIAEAEDPEEYHEFADDAVDVYNADRLEWLGSHLSRPGYCDEAAEELGTAEDSDLLTRIGLGQYWEASEVYASVLRALEERADEDEDEDEDA